MEGRLKALFDYQKFEGDRELSKVIAETDARTGGLGRYALDDDDLSGVAAGVEQTGRSGDTDGKKPGIVVMGNLKQKPVVCDKCGSPGPFTQISGGRLRCPNGHVFDE